MGTKICATCKQIKSLSLFGNSSGKPQSSCKTCRNEYNVKRRHPDYLIEEPIFLQNEVWFDIPGFEGLYKISNFHRVLSTFKIKKTGNFKSIIKKPVKSPRGYLVFKFRKEGKDYGMKLHRAIAILFIPNPDNLPEVLHLNDIKDDNRIENLKWGTHKQNMELAAINKLYADYNGERNPQAKLTNQQVKDIRASSKTTNELSIIYKMSKHQIWKIKSGGGWKGI